MTGVAELAGTYDAAARDTAERLIAATRRRSAEFPPDLANHLPMVLEILARLGATPARLAAYADRYDRENAVPVLPPTTKAITASDWHLYLGHRDREADYRAFFQAEVRERGVPGAVGYYVPHLTVGVAASALHALMRLAYAIMRKDGEEVGTALGYWAAAFLPLPQPERIVGDLDPLAVLLLMREVPAFADVRPGSELLWHWMRAVGNRPELAPLAGRLAVGPETLDEIAQVSLALYASTMSFEALHALTGAHWVRQIVPFLADPAPLLRSFWQTIMAVYPKIGMPMPVPSETLDPWRALPVPSDAEIKARAVASDDEHDPSLVFSALKEYARTGDRLYKVVAARRVGLMP